MEIDDREIRRGKAVSLQAPLSSLLLLLLLGATGCAPGESPASAGTERETIGDTTIVAVAATERPDTARLIPEVTIGSAAGEEGDVLARVIGLAVDDEGFVYLYDAVLESLRKYGPDGAFLGQVAPVGEGPREVGFASALAVDGRGRLLVADGRNARLALFDGTTPEPLLWDRPETRPVYGHNALRFDRSGQALVGIVPVLSADGTPERWPRDLFVRYTARGEVVDTIRGPARYLDGCVPSSRDFRSGFIEDIRAPYVAKVHWAWNPALGGLTIGCGARFAIDQWRADGSVLRIEVEGWDAAPATEAERRDHVEYWVWSKHERLKDTDFRLDADDLPAAKPAFTHLLAGEGGRIWVWRPRKSVPETGEVFGRRFRFWSQPAGGVFDVFDADGDYLGPVRLPDDVPFDRTPATLDPVIRGDTVWAVRVDELDVQYVVRYRIEWPDTDS